VGHIQRLSDTPLQKRLPIIECTEPEEIMFQEFSRAMIVKDRSVTLVQIIVYVGTDTVTDQFVLILDRISDTTQYQIDRDRTVADGNHHVLYE
jgi:hypothetical protein